MSNEGSEKWQREIRNKIEDIVSASTVSNCPFNAWELEFVESIEKKLNHEPIHLSPKQVEKILDLWEKI